MSSAEGQPPGRLNAKTLREWLDSEDPLLHHLAFHTALTHPETVADLTGPERIELLTRFLRDGLTGRYGDAIPDGPYVLAHTVQSLLRQLSESEDRGDRDAADAIVAMLGDVARNGDEAARDVIVLGVLEHAIEHPPTWALFDAWDDAPDLAPLRDEAVRLST